MLPRHCHVLTLYFCFRIHELSFCDICMTVVVNKGEAVYKYIKCGTCDWWLGEERRRPQSYYYGHFLSSWFQWQSGKCLMNQFLNWTCPLRFWCRRLKLSSCICFVFHALLCKYIPCEHRFLSGMAYSIYEGVFATCHCLRERTNYAAEHVPGSLLKKCYNFFRFDIPYFEFQILQNEERFFSPAFNLHPDPLQNKHKLKLMMKPFYHFRARTAFWVLWLKLKSQRSARQLSLQLLLFWQRNIETKFLLKPWQVFNNGRYYARQEKAVWDFNILQKQLLRQTHFIFKKYNVQYSVKCAHVTLRSPSEFKEGLEGLNWQLTNGQTFNWQLKTSRKFDWLLTFALDFTFNWQRTWLSLLFHNSSPEISNRHAQWEATLKKNQCNFHYREMTEKRSKIEKKLS